MLQPRILLRVLFVFTLILLAAAPIWAQSASPGWRVRTWPQTPKIESPPPSLEGWHIVVDPGHGGTDGGATGLPLQEKVFTLQIGLKLRALLINEGAQVTMTRETDKTVELADRVNLANSVGAHRYLSVHINACCGARGLETWVDADGTNRTKHPTTAAVWDAYAKTIHKNLVAGAHTIDSSLPNRNVKYSGTTNPWGDGRRIYVLREDRINMPSALVEINFIDTPSEYALLIRDDYQQAVAVGMANGFKEHAAEYNPTDGLLR